MVHEVGLDGRMARLQPPPKAVAAAGGGAAAHAGSHGDVAPAPADSAAPGAETSARIDLAAVVFAPAPRPPPSPLDDASPASAAFAALCGAESGEAVLAWARLCREAASSPQPSTLPPPLALPLTADKALRAACHAAVRVHLPWADSDTAGGGNGPKAVRLLMRPLPRKRAHPGGASSATHNGQNTGGRERKKPRGEDGGVGDACFASIDKSSSFLSFVLLKENVDTSSAVASIASLLRVPVGSLGFAGTKDRRGVTCQRATLRLSRRGAGDVAAAAARVLGLNKRLIGMRVGDIEGCSSPLGLGELRGNYFCVTLRGIDEVASPPCDIASAVAALRDNGFINYFGLQRFGASAGGRTHATGAALLRGDWAGAADRVLMPQEGGGDKQKEGQNGDETKGKEGGGFARDGGPLAAARTVWAATRDAAAALRLLPPGAAAEKALLSHFAKQQRDARNNVPPTGATSTNNVAPAATAAPLWPVPDIVGGLCSVPRPLRLMYIHAYQSHLWNHAATHRATFYGHYGLWAIEGDLVADGEGAAGDGAGGALGGGGDDVGFDEADDDDAASAIGGGSGGGLRVRHVTASEAASRSFPLSSVLLPLPSAASMYPLHATRDVYFGLAAADGVSLGSGGPTEGGGQHNSPFLPTSGPPLAPPHRVKCFSLASFSGGYRAVVARPMGATAGAEQPAGSSVPSFRARLVRYDDPSSDVARSDFAAWMETEGRRQRSPFAVDVPPKDPTSGIVPSPGAAAPDVLPECGEGKHVALQLCFGLPASCYATMAVRELTKRSSAAGWHAQQPHHAAPAAGVVVGGVGGGEGN